MFLHEHVSRIRNSERMSRKISTPHLHLICRETLFLLGTFLQRSFFKKGNLFVGVGDDDEDDDNDDDELFLWYG